MHKNAILLTATIRPPAGMPGSVNLDPQAREAEYIEALNFYLGQAGSGFDWIIFAENSQWLPDQIKAKLSAVPRGVRLTFLSTEANYPADKGKGFGEFYMLDQVMTQLAEKEDLRNYRFWKLTGRLKLRNVLDLVKSVENLEYDLYCDLRRVPWVGNALGGNRWMELRVWAFSQQAYDNLFRGRYGDGFVLEFVFFDAVMRALSEKSLKILPRFVVQPVLEGSSGFSGKSYSSLPYRIKSTIRALGRKYLKGLWI
jgi:hypothetical protein